MTREVFIAGQILTAAELNTVSDQTVMSFAGTASRGSAISSPVEGMTTYIEDSNSVQIYDGSAWKRVVNTTGSILQVVSTTKTDTFTTTSTSYTDVTGLSATITPSSTSSKVFVSFSVLVGATTSIGAFVTLTDGSNNQLIVPDSPGSREPSVFRYNVDTNGSIPAAFSFLHSPATTSAFTYKIRLKSSTGSVFINRSTTDTDSNVFARNVSTITVMEVAG